MAEAVLFDYGLTLVAFTYPRLELLRVLERVRPWLGADAPDAETILETVLLPLEDDLDAFGEDEVDYLDFYEGAWRRAGIEAPRDVLYRILDLEQRCWDAAVSLAPGTLEVLEGLRAQGRRLAVCSNAPYPPEMMHRQLEGNGIAQRVDAAVFSSEVGRRKPAPELYLAALERLGVSPGQALYVGDRLLEDYEGPRRVGMEAVLCMALARHRPPAGVPVIETLAELLSARLVELL